MATETNWLSTIVLIKDFDPQLFRGALSISEDSGKLKGKHNNEDFAGKRTGDLIEFTTASSKTDFSGVIIAGKLIVGFRKKSKKTMGDGEDGIWVAEKGGSTISTIDTPASVASPQVPKSKTRKSPKQR